MNAKTVPEGCNVHHILDLLALVAGVGFPPLVEPQAKLDDGEVIRGSVKSDLPKRLFSVTRWARLSAEKISEEHAKLHRCKTAVITECDCREFDKKEKVLMDRANLLNELKWLAIYEELPQAMTNRIGIVAGWSISGSRDEWSEELLFPDPNDPMNRIPTTVMEIMNGTKILTPDAIELPPELKDAEVGHLFGVIEDQRILSLLALSNQIIAHTNKTLLIDGKAFGQISEADARKWMRNQTVNELQRMEHIKNRCLENQKIVHGLLWQAIRDTFPGAADVGSLVIHPGWKVYESLRQTNPFASLLEELDGLFGGGVEIIGGGSPLGKAFLEAAKRSRTLPRRTELV